MPLQRNISFKKDYGALTEQGTLTMQSGGELINSGGDYGIDDNGFTLASGTDDEGPNALKFRDSFPSGTQRGSILADSSSNDLIINARSGYDLLLSASGSGGVDIYTLNEVSITGGDGVSITSGLNDDIVITSGNDTVFNNSDGDLVFNSLPNFDPNRAGVVYRDGNDLKVSTG